MSDSLDAYLVLSGILFAIGSFGFLARRNAISMLMSIELMLNAVNLAFVGFNRLWPGTAEAPALDGQVFVLMVITPLVIEPLFNKFEPLSQVDYYSLAAVFAPLDRPRAGREELAVPAGTPAQADPKQLVRTVAQSAGWQCLEAGEAWQVVVPVGPLRKQTVVVRFDQKDPEGHSLISYSSVCGPSTSHPRWRRTRPLRAPWRSSSPSAPTRCCISMSVAAT